MGRNKIEIKRISNERSRQSTFTKRKNGLLKKAMELSILCGCDVVLLVVSDTNKLYEYASKDLGQVIQKYDTYDKVHDSYTNEDYDTQFGSGKPTKKRRNSSILVNSFEQNPSNYRMSSSLDLGSNNNNNNNLINSSLVRSNYNSIQPSSSHLQQQSQQSSINSQTNNNISFNSMHSISRRQNAHLHDEIQPTLTPRTVQRYRAANKKYEDLLNNISSHSLLPSTSNRNVNMISSQQSSMNIHQQSSINQQQQTMNQSVNQINENTNSLGIFPPVSLTNHSETNNPQTTRKKFDAKKLTIKVPKYKDKQDRKPVPVDISENNNNPTDTQLLNSLQTNQDINFTSSQFPSMTPTLNLIEDLKAGMSPLPITPSNSTIPYWPWTPTPKDASEIQFDNYGIEEPPLKKRKLDHLF